jgi:hypothetical protein
MHVGEMGRYPDSYSEREAKKKKMKREKLCLGNNMSRCMYYSAGADL